MAEKGKIVWSRVLVEGVVVVLSVLVALGVDEWRGELVDRSLEREYLERLLLDLDENLSEITNQHRSQSSQLASARLIYPLVSRGDWVGLDTATAVRAAYFASPSPTPTWEDGTFLELSSTGRMALLRNPEVRADVLAYYRFLEARAYTYQLMSTAYRDAVRSRMDPGLQLALRTCRPRSPACAVEVEGPELESFVDWMSGNPDLAGGLRRVIVQWTRGEEEFLPQVEESTLELRALLESDLDR